MSAMSWQARPADEPGAHRSSRPPATTGVPATAAGEACWPQLPTSPNLLRSESLALVDDLFLIMLDDATGRLRVRTRIAGYALAGALLIELWTVGQVRLDGERIWVLGSQPLWDPLLRRPPAPLPVGQPQRRYQEEPMTMIPDHHDQQSQHTPQRRAPGLADWSGAASVGIDQPSAARVYDFLLGGASNFAVDRQAGQSILEAAPNSATAARANRAFLGRLVRCLVEAGVDQILDLGSGLPTVGNVHSVAQHANPRARVVYVDCDPVAVTHARNLVAKNGLVGVVEADLRTPSAVLDDPIARDYRRSPLRVPAVARNLRSLPVVARGGGADRPKAGVAHGVV